MSDVIRLLPDSVANQIAAGEVIQRPASVVKELVENAIDAGAHHVDVLVTDAGKTCIQVIDDGKGMSETDARLAFERHATSKIRQAADLFSLHTMGFRGEALASIAAVAQVDLRTCQEGEQLGTHICISGSKVESQEAIACSQGSNFSVKNLFFNIPARRKFLKSNQTELSNILAEFERIALVNPDVSFTLHHNDTEMLNLPAIQLRQRIMGVFGKKLNQDLLSLDIETSMVKIHGFIGKPETARKKGARQFFFANGRYMRHPYFHKAVVDAYENLIPAGEQVSYFIYFDVDPANIDVNIHPTKTEIKFENEQPIWFVEIDHGTDADGLRWVTLYAHMKSCAVQVGQTVTAAQVIGYLGHTGNTTGNACHFEMQVNGVLTEPRYFTAYTGSDAAELTQEKADEILAEAVRRAASDQTTAVDGAAALSGVDLFTLPVAPPPQVSGYDPENGHSGIDFAAEEGAEVYAVAGGIVTAADYDVEKGNYVVLDHGGGLETEYQHMKSLLVSAGQSVVQGQVLGYVGSTGNSTGPHLHFEARQDGAPADLTGTALLAE